MSWSRQAALIRTIQRRRNSPLRARRSRYAYWPECITCSVAVFRWRLRAPEYPSADARIRRRRFLEWTERLPRAMTAPVGDRWLRRGLRAPEEALHLLLLAPGDFDLTSEAPGAAARLLLEEMRPVRLTAFDLAAAGDLE